jgi:serine/threonine-protein kinase
MELDDMKLAWQTLDRRLDLQTVLNLQLLKEGKFDKMRTSLRPMRWAQILSIVSACALIVFAASIWATHWQQPLVLVSGLIMHIYGIAVCIACGRTLALISGIDYSAPVLSIQQQLATLRAFYLRCSFWLGNAWWLLWMPFAVLGWAWAGVPSAFYERVMPILIGSTFIGIAGICLTSWLHRRWQRNRPDQAPTLENQSVRGIAKAQKFLDEIVRFEKM